MADLKLYAPGQRVTGDLRLVGIISILLKNKNEQTILYHDGGEKTLPTWILNYLASCDVQLKPLWESKKSNRQNRDAINAFKKTVRVPWYVWYNDIGSIIEPNHSMSITGNINAEIIHVTDLHNIMVNRDNYFADIYPHFPLKANMNIAPFISAVQDYMHITPLPIQENPTLVIWFKDKKKRAVASGTYQYHQEHQISTSITIAILKKLEEKIIRLRLPPLNLYIKNDEKSREIHNLHFMKEAINCYCLEDIEDYIEKPLFEQYQWIGRYLPANTVHYGGRSGHLEPMPFLGHKVIYYEEIYNMETARIYDSLCSLNKNAEIVYVRHSDLLQTKGGAKKLLRDLGMSALKNLIEIGIAARLDQAEGTKYWVKEKIVDNTFEDLFYFLYPGPWSWETRRS